jgi:general secretion pathway protein D
VNPEPRARRGLAPALVVAAAGALAALGALAAPAPLSGQAQPRNLNFVNAPLADVIRALATAVGVNVVLTDVPDTRITFTTSVPIRPEDLGGVLESILEAHDLVLVQRGPVAQVLPAEIAPTTGLIRFGLDPGDPPALGLVTQLVPLQSVRADEAASALAQIASPRARIEPVARSNSLLITDLASNMTRYLELLRRLDERPVGEAGLRTYVVPLKYASAEDLALSLGQLFGIVVGGSRTGSVADRSLSRSLDAFREREAEAFRLRQPEPVQIVPVDTLSGGLVGSTTVVPDAPTNSLLIRTAPPNFPLLRETIEALDTRPPQVLFEVTVAEITLGQGQDFGVDWSVIGENASVRLGTPAEVDSLTPIDDFVVRVVTTDRANVRAVLRAVASTSNVRVLSTPEIMAANNREARIVVGSRIPFVASTRLGDFAVDRSVQYEDVGTTLTIIPTINQDDYVTVQILQEVNTLTNQVIAAALDAPVIATREASTRAIIRDGQTVVIGGLIGDARDYLETGAPFLKDIPLLGNLFKRRSEVRSRTELAIFVTPYIVRSDQDADFIRERIRSRMDVVVPADTAGVRR